MKKLKYFLLSIMLGSVVSCDYLDVVPDNVATIEYAFRNKTSAEKFLFTCYSYLPQHGDVSWDVAMSGGDEIWMHPFISWSTRDVAEGRQNASDPYMDYWNGTRGSGTNLWEGIRDCNIFLENIDKVIDVTSLEKTRWAAEVKFLKAYYHFYLFRAYGPIPVMDENLPISAGVEEVKKYREPVDTVITFITDLMYEAAQDLPTEAEVIEGTEAGRINDLIAMSTRAKVFVYAASPLFNGNSNYAGIIDNRGVTLFPQTYDESKWTKAAEACKEAIDLCHAQGKALYDEVDGQLADVHEIFKLQTTYRQAITDRWNKELIWGGTNNDCAYLSRMAQAKIMRFSATHMSIRSEWAPTMKMVNAYYSSNGVPIGEDAEWLENGWYDDRYKVRPEPSSGEEIYYVKEGEKTAYIHYNREPRFYASIGFDRGIYFGNGYYDFPGNVKHTEFKAKEYSGLSSASEMFSVTGYNVKKMHSYRNAVTRDQDNVEYYPFPVMRLADLYLLYAEALNESEGPVDAAFEYIDAVRARAGLDGVKESWANYSVEPAKPESKAGLRDIIQKERNIELAYEGKRFWDIRRWKQISEFNEQPMGWNAYEETEEEFYKPTVVAQTPVKFSTKHYLWPIREYDLSVNKNFVQNYGW